MWASIVDLALMAAQNDAPDLDQTVWDMVPSNVKAAVRVIRNVESGAESLAEFFAMEDRLEAKSNAHAGELLKRAKARLERITTDPNPAKATVIVDKKRLLYKRATAPPGAWTKADFEELLEVSVLHEPRFLAQRGLSTERRIKGPSSA